ncbi:hypothetical protein LCGC14_2270770 [marine sediment metagenome]|uniref:Uncharacterized protein n=1 Tax=marine sediment metagenome TaxID=412755 RepID=A0A0F9DJA3_9ZZZZ
MTGKKVSRSYIVTFRVYRKSSFPTVSQVKQLIHIGQCEVTPFKGMTVKVRKK